MSYSVEAWGDAATPIPEGAVVDGQIASYNQQLLPINQLFAGISISSPFKSFCFNYTPIDDSYAIDREPIANDSVIEFEIDGNGQIIGGVSLFDAPMEYSARTGYPADDAPRFPFAARYRAGPVLQLDILSVEIIV